MKVFYATEELPFSEDEHSQNNSFSEEIKSPELKWNQFSDGKEAQIQELQ